MSDRIKQIKVQSGRYSGETPYGIQSEVTDMLSIKTSLFGGQAEFDGSGDYLGKVANNGQLISTGYVYSLGRRIDSYYTIELGGKNKECNTISSMSKDTTLAGLQTKTEFTPEKKTGDSITCKLIPGCKYNLVLNYGYPEFKVNIDDLKDKLYNGQTMFIVFDNHTDKESILKWDYGTIVSDYVLMGGIEDGELTIQPQRYETMGIMLLNGTYFVCCRGGGGSAPVVENNGSITFEFDIDHFYTYTESQSTSKTYNIVFSPTPGTAKAVSNDTCTITARLKCASDSSVNISIPMDAFTYVDSGVTHTTSGTSTVVKLPTTAGNSSITLNYNWSDIFSKCNVTDGTNTGTGTEKYTFNVVTQKSFLESELEFGDMYFSYALEYGGGQTAGGLNPLGKCYHYTTSSPSIPDGGEIKLKSEQHEGNTVANAYYLNIDVNVKSAFYGDMIFDTRNVNINLRDFFISTGLGAFENIRNLIPKGIYEYYGYGSQIADDNTTIRSKKIGQMFGVNHLLSLKFSENLNEDIGNMGHEQIIWEAFSSTSSQGKVDKTAVITIRTTDGSGNATFNENYTYKVDVDR